jgi:hypothetical protein
MVVTPEVEPTGWALPLEIRLQDVRAAPARVHGDAVRRRAVGDAESD